MRSPLAENQRAALIEAMLPNVAFDGWSRSAVRAAARCIGMPADEALALFPNGAAELVGSERALGWEGCLSVPGLRGVVPRHLRVRYRGTSPEGKVIERAVEGFHARVVQHECDHLDGILYPQRMTDHRLLVFLEELQRHPIDLAAFLNENRAG